ncbi:MAG TPA: GNAT family N-acetyltransferase [Chitinophagaceae bacterium]|nr:GNAT family N-acetyltransferase [Chitinophagaceae bacterium]
MPDFQIREARREDGELLIELIRELAVYEKLLHAMQASPADLERSLFDEKSAQSVLAYEGDTVVGFALYFFNYSTFVGRKGLYLEDLFIRPEFRGKGYGKKLLLYLAKLAHEQGCGRMEWSVLNWNTPAIQFYESLGAKPMDEWTVYRLDADGLGRLAKR